MVNPAIHDDSRAVGREDNLHIRVQLKDKVDEPFLPVDMQANLRLIHKKDIVLVVLDEHGKQNGKNLLLTTRQLIRHKRLPYLRETNLILRPDNLFARVSKEIIHNILELF